MRLSLVILASVLAVLAASERSADELTGTLKKIRDSRAITLGYRESSIPFSFLNRAAARSATRSTSATRSSTEAASELGSRPIEISIQDGHLGEPLRLLRSGDIDLECGSTTNNRLRRRRWPSRR